MRRVRLTLEIAEAMPVVRAVARHRQQVPRDSGHLDIEILHERRRLVADRAPVIAVYQPAHARQVRFGGRLKRVQQVDDGVKSFVARDEITRFVGERALGQRRDVSAEHEERHVGHDVLDRGRQRRGSRHVLGGRRRLVTIDDDGGEHRRKSLHAIRDLLGCELVGFGIDNLDRETLVPVRTWR